MWKTTDRYVQQKRVKAVEAESKLKQVYIPNYTKQSPALITNNKSILNGTSNGNGDIMSLGSGKSCESCSTTSSQAVSHLKTRLLSLEHTITKIIYSGTRGVHQT